MEEKKSGIRDWNREKVIGEINREKKWNKRENGMWEKKRKRKWDDKEGMGEKVRRQNIREKLREEKVEREGM